MNDETTFDNLLKPKEGEHYSFESQATTETAPLTYEQIEEQIKFLTDEIAKLEALAEDELHKINNLRSELGAEKPLTEFPPSQMALMQRAKVLMDEIAGLNHPDIAPMPGASTSKTESAKPIDKTQEKMPAFVEAMIEDISRSALEIAKSIKERYQNGFQELFPPSVLAGLVQIIKNKDDLVKAISGDQNSSIEEILVGYFNQFQNTVMQLVTQDGASFKSIINQENINPLEVNNLENIVNNFDSIKSKFETVQTGLNYVDLNIDSDNIYNPVNTLKSQVKILIQGMNIVSNGFNERLANVRSLKSQSNAN